MSSLRARWPAICWATAYFSFRPLSAATCSPWELEAHCRALFIAGTLASYLLGDSVLQFSTIIGCYLFAMGIGSALSRYIDRGLAYRFVWIELLLGVIGGCSSALLFLAFAYTQGFQLLMYSLVVVIGILVGLEIPLLMRLVRGRYHFRDVVAHVLTFDYLGALGASLLFPILLVPRLGLVAPPCSSGCSTRTWHSGARSCSPIRSRGSCSAHFQRCHPRRSRGGHGRSEAHYGGRGRQHPCR